MAEVHRIRCRPHGRYKWRWNQQPWESTYTVFASGVGSVVALCSSMRSAFEGGHSDKLNGSQGGLGSCVWQGAMDRTGNVGFTVTPRGLDLKAHMPTKSPSIDFSLPLNAAFWRSDSRIEQTCEQRYPSIDTKG